MKIEQFIELIDNPSRLAETHISSIEKILSDYPFFQSAHLLYAKALQNSKHINHHNALKRTAVIAGNRAVLYRLINQPAQQITQPVVEAKIELVVEKEEIKQEKAPEIVPEEKVVSSPINYVYTIVSKDEPVVNAIEPEKPVENEQTETLNEIILNPIVEAYIETEILKINEKEPEIKIEEPQSFTEWLKQLPAISKQLSVSDQPKTESVKKEVVSKPQSPKHKTEK